MPEQQAERHRLMNTGLLRGVMQKRLAFAVMILLVGLPSLPEARSPRALRVTLKVGVAALPITPFGANPDWDGTITESGVWGERFSDTNHNGRWDAGEPFTDDPDNTALDASSKGKYDGIYLAGFGNHRIATG